jgi:hypothetical protein
MNFLRQVLFTISRLQIDDLKLVRIFFACTVCFSPLCVSCADPVKFSTMTMQFLQTGGKIIECREAASLLSILSLILQRRRL